MSVRALVRVAMFSTEGSAAGKGVALVTCSDSGAGVGEAKSVMSLEGVLVFEKCCRGRLDGEVTSLLLSSSWACVG